MLFMIETKYRASSRIKQEIEKNNAALSKHCKNKYNFPDPVNLQSKNVVWSLNVSYIIKNSRLKYDSIGIFELHSSCVQAHWQKANRKAK